MEKVKTYDTIDMFIYLWKKRLPIIIVTIAAAVFSIIVSLMMDDYFKASSVVFPTTFISPSTSLLERNTNQEMDPMIIGNEDDVERMIQILKSDYIADRIIQKYNLLEHYGFSHNEPYVKTKVKKAYESSVTISKTSYQAVVISAVDIDPKIASDIANDIANLYDSLVNDMQKLRAEEAYKTAQKAYESVNEYIIELEDSLDIYRQLGVLDYYKEAERYSEAYGKAIGNNTLTQSAQKFFDKKFELLKKYGKESQALASYINQLKENLALLHINLTKAEQNVNNLVTHKYIASYAQPPDKKTSPKRSFIVVFSTLGGFLFIIALLLFFDFFKELKKRIKQEK